MRPLISVIIPFYNVVDWLPASIDSVLAQSYKNIELILVDDGSTDGSDTICDDYARNDSRVKVVHKKNGGVSDARNFGVDYARGDYIAFVDSDDIVSSEYIERMYEALIENDADMVQCGSSRNEHDLIAPKNSSVCGRSFSREESFKSFMLQQTITVTIWGKLYKRDLYYEPELIRYPVGKLNEDDRTTFKLISAAKRIFAFEECLYFYRKREGSIMNRPVQQYHLDLVDAADEMIEYFKERGEDYHDELEFYRFSCMTTALEHLLLDHWRSEYKDQEKELVKMYTSMNIKNPYVKPQHKLAIILTKISPEFLKLLFQIRL